MRNLTQENRSLRPNYKVIRGLNSLYIVDIMVSSKSYDRSIASSSIFETETVQ